MRSDRCRRAASALVSAMVLGISLESAVAQGLERHGKSIKQCNDELKANVASLAKAGESPADFFHDCWWRTAAGHTTRIRGVEASGNSEPSGVKDRARADTELAKAKQEAAAAKQEAAKAMAATQAAQARAADAEAKMKAQAESEAKARAEADAKAKAAAAQAAAARAEQAAKVRAAADAFEKAKAEQAARVAAAAAALKAAKAQQAETYAKMSAGPAPSLPHTTQPAKARPRLAMSARPQLAARVRPAIARRRYVVTRPFVVPAAERRRLLAAAARPAPTATAAASPPIVMVPVQIPGLGLKRPIAWPVFPAYVPAFRSVVNNPIVPGFTRTP